MTTGLLAVCEGNIVINTSTVTGVLRDFMILSSESSGTLSYPDLAGRTIYTASARGLAGQASAYSPRTLSISVSYSSGFPVVTYSPTGSGTATLLNLYIIVE
jgi:hypothetical protein